MNIYVRKNLKKFLEIISGKEKKNCEKIFVY